MWTERTPSRTPCEPREAVVDHVAGRTFTVSGLEAVFNRSTGRSKPVKPDPRAFASDTYVVAVEAGSERAREAFGAAELQDRTAEAARAVNAWLADRTQVNRRAATDTARTGRCTCPTCHTPTRTYAWAGNTSTCAVKETVRFVLSEAARRAMKSHEA